MNQIYTCEDTNKMRLDAFLAQQADISRVQAKKAIDEGLCLVRGAKVKPNYKVQKDDTVSYTQILVNSELEAEEGHLEILYRDNDYVIINKPPNLTVHPSPSQESGTLVHILLSHFPSLKEMEGLRPGIVHRIDKDTSGILVIALHDKARRALSESFAQRQVHKEYLALVHNIPKDGQGQVIDLPIGRHESQKTKMAVSKNGKNALTEFKVIHADTRRNYALLGVRIHTGRTHQIRVHLSHSGLPLWGDKTYTAKILKPIPSALQGVAKRQMLHAWKISFIQPITNEEISITCDIPQDMQMCLDRLKAQTKKYIVTGNAGSGKSLILQFAKEAGYPIFSADAYVSSLYQKDAAGTFLLSRTFGEEILGKDGAIDKKILSEHMQEEESRKKIEKIIHPLVYKAMEEFFEKCVEEVHVKAFAEIPLYFESGAVDNQYTTLCVWTEEDIRHKRLQERGWSEDSISFFDNLQFSSEEKKQLSDICLENSTTIDDLKKIFENTI